MSEIKKSPTAPNENKTLERQIKELKSKVEERDMKIMRMKTAEASQPSNETQAVIENLQQQMEDFKKAHAVQPIIISDKKKDKYRSVLPENIGDDPITFTARCVTKVIPGFMDGNGVEVIAPHKMIVLSYAASDIRQNGKEEEILTFCSYTTKLLTEIDFLRAHPEYNQTFGENMNEVAGHNPKEYQFKTRAAETVSSMSPESVLSHAQAMDIPNFRNKGIKALKDIILQNLVQEYVKEADSLQNDLKKRLLAQAAKAVS